MQIYKEHVVLSAAKDLDVRSSDGSRSFASLRTTRMGAARPSFTRHCEEAEGRRGILAMTKKRAERTVPTHAKAPPPGSGGPLTCTLPRPLAPRLSHHTVIARRPKADAAIHAEVR